jgi:hypothetical protein
MCIAKWMPVSIFGGKKTIEVANALILKDFHG